MKNIKIIILMGSIRRSWIPAYAGMTSSINNYYHNIKLLLAIILFNLLTLPVEARNVSLTDDLGRTLQVDADVPRWISLAPHLTDDIQAAGLADRLIAVDSYSPEPIKKFPKAAAPVLRLSGLMPHQPTLFRLRPAIVWVWYTSPATRLLALERAGIPVFYSHPKTLASIPLFLEKLKPFDTQAAQHIDQVISAWHGRIQALQTRYKPHANTPFIRIFHPFGWNPLLSFNHTHWLSEAFQLCGVQSVTDSLALAEPIVNPSYVLEQHTDRILLAERRDFATLKTEWIKSNPRLAHLPIVQVDPDLWHRPSIRFIEGLEAVCTKLHQQ